MTLLTQIIQSVARARRLSPEDAEDFAQTVQLRVLEREYDVFRQFDGRSSLKTYLTVVVTRMLLDWRNSTRGKWRPSAAAVRLGPIAIAYERMTARDGCAVAEAIAMLCSRFPHHQREEFEAMIAQLPIRQRRRWVAPEEADAAVTVAAFDEAIERTERRQIARRVLLTALRGLSGEDRQLLRVRFGRSQTMQEVARAREIDPARLYRRLAVLLKRLRATLRRAGVTSTADILDLPSYKASARRWS
jgi:RNA polymerase sigma factor for flagellar operon FliA